MWLKFGSRGYIKSALAWVPSLSHRGTQKERTHKWDWWLRNPCHLGGSKRLKSGRKSELAHRRACWVHDQCPMGGPPRLKAVDEITNDTQFGRGGYTTSAIRGSPTIERGGGGKIRNGPNVGLAATKLMRQGSPQKFRVGDKIRSGPQVGLMAT